jgi:WD40 repeat protein
MARTRTVIAAWAAVFAPLGAIAALAGLGWLQALVAVAALLAALGLAWLATREARQDRRDERRAASASVRTHFEPRARGVTRAGEPGRYFTGREAVLRELLEWLAGDDTGPRVVTGGPGSGKSAVLGRVVAGSDPQFREGLGAGPVPEAGAVGVRVHAHGKTLVDVVAEAARAAGVAADSAAELVAALVERGAALVLVLDALDEASGEGSAREIARELLAPLARDGRRVGIRVLVGTRRDSLLAALGSGWTEVDLDDPRYFSVADLAGYVERILADGAAYAAQPELAARVAARVAERAQPSFLIAGLVARSLVEADGVADPDGAQPFPADVGQAMEDYLAGFGSERRRVRDLLTALAFAEGDGLPEELWPDVASAVSRTPYGHGDVRDLLDGRATSLVIGADPYRLFHEALAEHLRAGAGARAAQARIVAALRAEDWPAAHPYVKRHLIAHAAAGAVVDELVEDPAFLLVSSPSRTLRALPAAGEAAQPAAHAYLGAVQFLRRTPPAEHASYLSLAALRAGAAELAERTARLPSPGPWSALWVQQPPASYHYVAGRHDGAVRALAVTEHDDRALIVAGSHDGAVKLWDLDDAILIADLEPPHRSPVWLVAVVEHEGKTLVLSAARGDDVQAWDLATRLPREPPAVLTRFLRDVGPFIPCALGVLDGRPTGIKQGGPLDVLAVDLGDGSSRKVPMQIGDLPRALALGAVRGAPVLVVGDNGAAIRLHSLAGGEPDWRPAPVGQVEAVAVSARAPSVLAAASSRYIHVWDMDGDERDPLTLSGHTGTVHALAVLTGEPRMPALVSGAHDGTVRVWDVGPGGAAPRREAAEIEAIALGERDGLAALLLRDEFATVRVVELATGRELAEPFEALGRGATCVICAEAGERPLLVTGHVDGSVSAWDMEAGAPLYEPFTLHTDVIEALATGVVDGRSLLVSCARDRTVRVWDLAAGEPLGDPLERFIVGAVALSERAGRPVVLAAGGAISVWDLADRERGLQPLFRPPHGVFQSMATGMLGGRRAVAGGSNVDGSVSVWDVDTEEQIGERLVRHKGAVMSLAIGELAGRDVVVAGGEDGTVTLSRPGVSAFTTIDTGTRGSVRDLLIGPDSTLVIRSWHGLAVVRINEAPGA